MPAYIDKKHYHLGKKVANVRFGWYPDTNPLIFRLEGLSLVENTVKHIHFQDHIQEIMFSINHV